MFVSDLDPNKLHFLRTVPEAKKHAEEKILGMVHAKTDWSHKSDTELHVLCTIQNDANDVRKLAKDWEDRVRQSTKFLFESIQIGKRECLKKTWKEVSTEVQKISKESQNVAIIKRAEESSLYVVGRAGTVKNIYQQVNKMCKDIEEKLDHIKDTTDLNELEMAVFQKSEKQKLGRKYPKVKINLQKTNVEFEGPATDLLSIQKELNSFLRDMLKKNLILSKGQVKVLKMLQKQPNSQLSNATQKLQAVIKIDGKNVVIFGSNKDVTKYEEILTNNIKETTIEITEEEKTAFTDSIWNEFSNFLFMRYNGILHLDLQEDKSSVNLVAHQNDFHGALEEVKNHIQKNAVRAAFVELEIPHTRMITQWMKEDIAKVEKDFERYGIKISCPDNYGIVITGTEDGLAPVKDRVERLKGRIITDTHTVTTPGMPHYFTQQDMGKYFIKSQEERHHVIIYHEDPDREQENMGMRRPVPQPRSNKKELQQATHASGVVIKAIVGDMTSHQVDAIVNAANGNLAHVGGLAKAIVDKGNPAI